MRKFKYLGPATNLYKKGQIVDYDGASATPDGGGPQDYWLELVDQPEAGD